MRAELSSSICKYPHPRFTQFPQNPPKIPKFHKTISKILSHFPSSARSIAHALVESTSRSHFSQRRRRHRVHAPQQNNGVDNWAVQSEAAKTDTYFRAGKSRRRRRCEKRRQAAREIRCSGAEKIVIGCDVDCERERRKLKRRIATA